MYYCLRFDDVITGAQPRGQLGHSPPEILKHCIVVFTFAETFKE